MFDRITTLKHVISEVCKRTGYTEKQVELYYKFFIHRFQELAEREDVYNIGVSHGFGTFFFTFNYGGRTIRDTDGFKNLTRSYARKMQKIKTEDVKYRVRHYRYRNINLPSMVGTKRLQEVEDLQNKYYAKKREFNQ